MTHELLAAGWICLKERELVGEKRSQGRYITIQITYLGGELPSALLLSLSPLSSHLGLAIDTRVLAADE